MVTVINREPETWKKLRENEQRESRKRRQMIQRRKEPRRPTLVDSLEYYLPEKKILQ